jgi:hypothetical protein
MGRGHQTTAEAAAGYVHSSRCVLVLILKAASSGRHGACVTPITASLFRCHVRDPYICVRTNQPALADPTSLLPQAAACTGPRRGGARKYRGGGTREPAT